MPIFDFKCTKCNNISEDYLPSHNNSNPKCVKCGETTKRMLSGFAIDMDGIVISSPRGRAELHQKGAKIV